MQLGQSPGSAPPATGGQPAPQQQSSGSSGGSDTLGDVAAGIAAVAPFLIAAFA
jgi:hypothetical protein